MSKANKAVAPAQSAVPATQLAFICGKPLAEAQASLEEIFGLTADAEKMITRGDEQRDRADGLLLDWLTQWHEVDGKLVKMRQPKLTMAGEPIKQDGKPVTVYVPISYDEFRQVMEWSIAKYYDAGAATPEAAERQAQRQIERLVKLDWVRPTSKKPDAERMAKKRAEQIAKFENMSDGDLAERKAELLAKGDTKSIALAQSVNKEIERREKPAIDAAQSQRVAVRDKLITRAKELCKAGTADADEKLIAALQALA